MGRKLLEVLWQDLRYAGRRLRKTPGFTAVAISIMGIGIGANTAIFSLINGAFLRPPLPYRNPSETVRIYSLEPGSSRPSSISYPDFLNFRDQSDLFVDTAATNDGIFVNILTEDGAETFVGRPFRRISFRSWISLLLWAAAFCPRRTKQGPNLW